MKLYTMEETSLKMKFTNTRIKGFIDVMLIDKDGKEITMSSMVESYYKSFKTSSELKLNILKSYNDNARRNVAINNCGWEENTFTIEGAITSKGIHKPLDTWNGWACPYFTKEQIKDLFEQDEDMAMYYKIRIDGDKAFLSEDQNDWEEYELSTHTFNDKIYYHISGWCWNIKEEE